MYKIGDKVIHYREGLSTIDGSIVLDGNNYFVVHSSSNPVDNIYVSTNKPEKVLRPIMNKEEAFKLIESMKAIQPFFSQNTKQRRDNYKRRIYSGNVDDLAFLYKQLLLYFHLNQVGQPVKLGQVDLEMLFHAKKVILDEITLSLGKSENEVEELFKKTI